MSVTTQLNLQSLALRFVDDELWVLDQQLLPAQTHWIKCNTIEDMCVCIKALKVRGAPLIGVAAVLSLAQYVQQGATIPQIKDAIQILVATRPTAVNLKHYMQRILQQLNEDPLVVLELAQEIFMEDKALCDKMATIGCEQLAQDSIVMTYCNTGGLATAGVGTALGVIKKAHQLGKVQHVYACETRPLLQGGRLTAWELENAQIPYTLICDNMAATVMQQQPIAAILVGADRIAANGDTANKIGTFSLAVLAKYHQIPFYVVAPYTTFDANCANGQAIVIEERDPAEVKGALGQISWAPANARVFNPSFDVTPASLISGFIMDNGFHRQF